jgi:1,4-dihydroxy-2-naphthoate octaprenyltransferase
MRKILLWLKAIRAPFFTASIIPVLVGAALSHREGVFQWPGLVFALLIVIAHHAGSNLLNDYFDAPGSDRINQSITPFSGGSRLIQDGLVARRSYLTAALATYSAGMLLTIVLAISYYNLFILVLGMMGMIFGIVYSATYTFGMGRGWGELAVGLAFGPFAVLGSYLLQTNHLSWGAFLAGIPVGLLVMGILILNEFPDLEADRTVGKRNWLVRAGDVKRGVWIYLGVICLAYLTVLAGIFAGVFPVKILFSYTTLPLAVWVLLKVSWYKGKVAELVPAMAGNVGLHFLTGLLICVGIW